MSYMVRLREQGELRHKLLGDKRLTSRRVRARTFTEKKDAEDSANWMLPNNEELDSAQVIDAASGRVLVGFGASACKPDAQTANS